MNIIEYKVIKDENRHPILMNAHKYKWDESFEDYGKIVRMMNQCFNMNKLNEEYGYIVAFDYNLNILGVYEVCHGSSSGMNVNNKEIYTFLLLVGAEQFVLLHNHPSGNLQISNDDYNFTSSVNAFSALININLIESIVIAGDGYSLILKSQIDKLRG